MKALGRKLELFIYFIFFLFWGMSITSGVITFAASKSTSYQLVEPLLGGFGQNNSQSVNIISQQSGGTIGVGTSSDTGFQIKGGHLTTNDPSLSFDSISTSNFGSFSPLSTSTATTTFSISDYTSYGYIVQIVGTPPTNSNGYIITPLSTNSAPQVGTNQFGLNLVANSIPTTFGNNPIYGLLGSGSINANYNVANQYRFVSGDTIAQSNQSSGQTTYTISYIVDVADLIPGGQYQSLQNIVCTPTY